MRTGTREVTRQRTVATCGQCGRRRAGVTRTETWPWRSTSQVAHTCDECIAAVVERPLVEVVADIAGERV